MGKTAHAPTLFRRARPFGKRVEKYDEEVNITIVVDYLDFVVVPVVIAVEKLVPVAGDSGRAQDCFAAYLVPSASPEACQPQWYID